MDSPNVEPPATPLNRWPYHIWAWVKSSTLIGARQQRSLYEHSAYKLIETNFLCVHSKLNKKIFPIHIIYNHEYHFGAFNLNKAILKKHE